MATETLYHCDNEIIEWRWSSDHEMMIRPHWTSCYFVDGVLIDSGPPGGIQEFQEFVISIDPNNVKLCILTHSHEDHAGGAHLLREEFNIPIYASKEAIPILRDGYTYPEYRQIAWGSELLPVETILTPNPIYSETKYCFDLLPIPGHAPDQVALIEKKQQWAFVTDGVIPKYKRIFGATSNIQENISQIYQSIEDLCKFTEGMDNLQIFLPGRDPVFGRDYLIDRKQEIMTLRMKANQLYEQGFSIKEITQKIFPGDDIFDLLTNGELSSRNLIISLIKWES